MTKSTGDVITKCGTATPHLRIAQIGLITAVVLAFFPVFHADFSNWDDNYVIADNPRMNPPTWQSVGYYWSHEAFDLYIPMTYVFWACLAKISYVAQPDVNGWHVNPYLFHAANVVAHIGSALLTFSILRKLLPRSLFAAWAGAMVFALHPVQVESVAWIAGLKDVLAGMFALAALRLYFDDGRPNRQRWCFTFAMIALIIAILCKPIAMVLPLMAAVIDLILKRRPMRQTAVRFAIWIWLAVACAIVARTVQPPKPNEVNVSPPARLLIAGDALAFYSWKLIWPTSLGIDYGRLPAKVLAHHVAYLTCLAPIALVMLLWFRRQRWKFAFAGAAVFLIGLAPVLGLIPFGFQRYSTVADHYLYLPMLGIAIVVAGILAAHRGRGAMIFSGIVLLTLAVRTFQQSQIWESPLSLFSHAVQVNPQSWIAHQNFAWSLAEQGDLPKAESQVRLALAIKPDYENAETNLAHILVLSGDPVGAIAAYRRALQLNPNAIESWASLGNALSRIGKGDEAIEAYRHAQTLSPNDPKAIINLASSLAENGELDQAIQFYFAALKLDPNSPEAQQGLARATAERDRRPTGQRQTTQP